MVGVLARDHLDLVGLPLRLPVEAGGLEGGLVGLGAAAGEEDGGHVRVGEAHDLGGELGGGDVRVAHVVREVGELLHLLEGGAGQLLPAVPHAHVPEAGEAVDVLVAVDVLDDRAVPLHDHERLGRLRGVVERVDDV